jgi:trehalose 6-phosphate synthase/phosphatase
MRGYFDPSSDPILAVSAAMPVELRRGRHGFETRPATGGLVSTLGPVLRKRGGGWLGGVACDAEREVDVLSGADYHIAALPLRAAELEGYLHGFADCTLWPLLHSFPLRTRFEPRDWEAYRSVNQRFARAAEARAPERGLVWFHDHHLMLAPLQLRLRRPELPIAFFLHVPFPPYDVFRLLPWRREILEGLLAADFLGFQVEGYAANFADCAERLLGARVDREHGSVETGRGRTRVGAVPIGIDFDRFAGLAREGERPRGLPERFLLAADRLEHTKGIPERIRMMERLLERHPEHRERITLLQIAVPARAPGSGHRELKREIDELVGRVNGRFASSTWSPIRYLHHAFSQAELAAFYRHADVALATPLRDGMNLVAKEFVACRVDEPGVLVLSELAGAAESMREALLVNPHDVDGTAEVVHTALGLAPEERAWRMRALRDRERQHDVHAWLADFLDAAAAPEPERER